MKPGPVVVALLFFPFSVVAKEAVGPCPHPYLPMDDGLKLTYRAGRDQIGVRLHSTESVAQGLKSKLEVQVGTRTGTTDAFCGKDGVRTEAGGLEGLALRSSGLDVKILASEGVAFPPPSEMTA